MPELTDGLVTQANLASVPAQGDCNADSTVNAGDLSALALRAFGQGFGANQGCDANHDLAVDAADFSCDVLIMFGGADACGAPDPTLLATPIDPTVATDIAAATEFLYTGYAPVQRGVAPGTIEARRVVVLRGQVRDRAGVPIGGVRVDVLDHPEFGWSFTRADGMFDLAVNGGGLVTVRYSKPGLLPVQRDAETPWRDYVWLEDVVMIPLDPAVTMIDLASPAPMQVARGSEITDERGTRRHTLLFPAGTTATITKSNGTTMTLSAMHVRMTEYTVGETGPDAMPGELPPTSAYTYAVELTVDEAAQYGGVKINGKDVVFSQPVLPQLNLEFSRAGDI